MLSLHLTGCNALGKRHGDVRRVGERKVSRGQNPKNETLCQAEKQNILTGGFLVYHFNNCLFPEFSGDVLPRAFCNDKYITLLISELFSCLFYVVACYIYNIILHIKQQNGKIDEQPNV